jgi:4-amino-4-deoxy-L-arabinose transferase-like glycosyltransferase
MRNAPPTPVATVAASAPPFAAGFTRQELLLLFGITIAAAVLRLIGLGEWSLWVDEVHSLRDALKPLPEFWDAPNAQYYPLSYLLLHALLPLMPSSLGEGWLRLPFAFFGILSVPLLALVGRPIVGNRAALVAATLLALSPWHIFWSQNVRAYAMVLFFGTLGGGAFFVGLERRSWWLLTLGLLTTLLAGFCHASAFLLLAVFGVYALITRRRPGALPGRWLPLVVIALLTVLIVLLLPLLQVAHRNKPESSVLHLAQTTAFFVRVPLLIAALGGILWLFDRGERAASFLLSWAVVPLLALAIASVLIEARATAQYCIYTLPAFCLAAGVIVVALTRRLAGPGLRGTLLRAIPLGVLLVDMFAQDYLYYARQHGDRPRWAEAALHAQRQGGTRMRVISTNGPSMAYYLNRNGLVGQPTPGGAPDIVSLADFMLKEQGGGDQYLLTEIRRARLDGVALYVILTEPELYEMDQQKLFDSALRREFREVLWLPNWNGPKDMCVHVYELPRR